VKTVPLLLLLLAGCAAPAPRVIQFSSEPAGARVFYGVGANDKFAEPKTFLGICPFTWTPEQTGNGEFKLPGALVYSTFVPPVIIFEARWTNGATARESFHGGTIATGADKIPTAIFFEEKR
jgi:hypothetical protein